MTTTTTRRLGALGVATLVLLAAGLYSADQLTPRAATMREVVSTRRLPRLTGTATTTPRRVTPTTQAPTTTTAVPTTTQAPTSTSPPTTPRAPRAATPTTPTPPTTTAPAPVRTVPPVTAVVVAVPASLPSGVQQQMLALVNTKRVAGLTCGSTVFPAVPALSLSPTLTRASDAFALDMASRNYFSHTGADGSDPGDRIAAAGYRFSAWAENIAAGQTTPDAVIAGWFDSAGHCANFMSSVVTQVGFGKAENPASTYGIYWVAELGRPG